MEEDNITWRTFSNGPEGTSGPTSRAWTVSVWPTLYLIDHEGVIRFKGPRGEKMDEEEFFAYCKDKMVKYKRPVEVTFVDALPRTRANKIDRIALRALAPSE